MQNDAKVRIQYAAKYQGISNSWKKWQGEIKGLERLDAVNKKIQFEEEFKNWAIENEKWEAEYKTVFTNFEKLYNDYKNYVRASDYYSEIVFRGVEIFRLTTMAQMLVNDLENNQVEKAEKGREALLNFLPAFYKDYNQTTDEKLFASLIPLLANSISEEFLPSGFKTHINSFDDDELIAKIYRKSIFADEEKLTAFLNKTSDKKLLKLRKDPIFDLFRKLRLKHEMDISPVLTKISGEIERNMKIYMTGIMEMKKDEQLYPDANLTLRVTYGKVEGYQPRDGVEYNYYTTLSGIMEKDNPDIYDYDVPDRLKQLYGEKDFGRYEVNGTVPVCFTASNHTSGGNSGSPVVNAHGELIGVNFERCWEGTMSDIMFDPDVCRNISLDIRYALFIIDKFAGAGYLIDEMEIVE